MSPETSVRLAGLLLVLGLFAVGAYKLDAWGDERYQAGYDARDLEVKTAQQAAQIKIDTVEARQNENAIKLDKLFAESRKRSDLLAQQIREASFNCGDLGSRFVELYNQGTAPAGHN